MPGCYWCGLREGIAGEYGDRVFCTAERLTVWCIYSVHSIHEAVFNIGAGAASFPPKYS